MTELTGYFAALGTSVLFAFTSTLFTLASRQVGSALVNRTRLLLAVIFVMILHTLSFGQPIPLDAGIHPWFWLGISGFVGLALGDAFLFQAFVLVGPRIGMLMMALAPVMGAFLAWLFLGERLAMQELIGIVLTVSGIAWVVIEPNARSGKSVKAETVRDYTLGILFGLGAAMGQASGLTLSKIGLENGFPALSGNFIRMSIAMIAIWLLAILRGEVVSSVRTLRQHPRALLMLTFGAITGPTTGVWLSLIAVQNAPIGVASTLMSLTPIFLLPISYVVFHERISPNAILGTVIAFAGTALLFL